MERTQLFDLMGELKLYGMKAAFDEIMATAVKRQHEPQRIVGDLLNAEISEKQALLSQLDQAKMQETVNTAMATLSEAVGEAAHAAHGAAIHL